MTTDEEAAVERSKIIDAYFNLLEEHSQEDADIWDVSTLPYEKEIILKALQMQIAKESNDDIAEIYKQGAAFLSSYQEGIGPEPLKSTSVDYENLVEATSTSNKERINELVETVLNDPDSDKREAAFERMKKDAYNIWKKILAAEAARQKFSK